MIIVGNGIYETCWGCGKLVKLNRWIFGGWHFCLISEELLAKHEAAFRKAQGIIDRPKDGQS